MMLSKLPCVWINCQTVHCGILSGFRITQTAYKSYCVSDTCGYLHSQFLVNLFCSYN